MLTEALTDAGDGRGLVLLRKSIRMGAEGREPSVKNGE